jgi:hypothetical protein
MWAGAMSEQLHLLQEGERRRDEGMQRATGHADRQIPKWSERAYSLLRSFAFLNPDRIFKTEDVRKWATPAFIEEPPDRRAWGSVLRRASLAGVIRHAGYGCHQDPSRHRGLSTLWRVA